MELDSKVWNDSFDVLHWKNEDKINELIEVIGSMGRVIEKYLKKTEIDFPNLTDHSINHSQILWKYTDIIIGNKKYYLNPLEGFILNSAFLLHDAGMCYSILNNRSELLNDLSYKDYIKNNKDKIQIEELELEALFYTVRENHGDNAIRIASELINNEDFFIGDLIYREEFSDIIGKIAKSHTCNINYIERELGNYYTSPKFPKDWKIDLEKLAYLLRAADAADIDNLRTPRSLKMISEIKGDSKDHWTFQKKLGFPSLDIDGYLIYSTNTPFKHSEQKAWWFCYNALRTLDDELKSANDYFISKKRIGFDAKSVKYINNTISLGQNSIKTIGWEAINTSIRVSNPIHIASELGGQKLYRDITIAIRELIQNSIDAIHVYRFYTQQDNLGVGKINILIEESNNNYFLVITDNGIGMSQNLMTNELLDFGGSYWKSNKFYNDFKGLVSKGFESIGKFGIGFFASFMLGNEITVTSWKYGENINTVRTLDFYEGLLSNPILRDPTFEERNRIIDRGTSVRIKLPNNPYKEKGFLYQDNQIKPSLISLVQHFVPSVDVELYITELDGSVNSILPNSMNKLNFLEMLDYLNQYESRLHYHERGEKYKSIKERLDFLKDTPIELIEILDGNKILGKLFLLPDFKDDEYFPIETTALVLSKGIRVEEIEEFVGYIDTEEIVSIKRDEAAKIISFDSMKIWAKKQLEKLSELNLEEHYEDRIKDILIAFNFYDENFIITKTKKDGIYYDVTIAEFRNQIKVKDSIVLYQEAWIVKDRSNSCDGFINIAYGLELEEIIKEEDLEKVNHTEKIIKKMIKDEWLDFELIREDLESNNFEDNDPYVTMWKFTKKNN